MTETTPPTGGANPVPSSPEPTPTAQTPPPAAQPESTPPGEPAAAPQPGEQGATPGQEGQEDEATRRNKTTAKERISQLTAERRAAEARASAAETELHRLRQSLRPPAPDASQEEHDEFRIRKAVREERADELASEVNVAAQQKASTRLATFTAKAEVAADRMPGLVDKFLSLPEVSEVMADFVADSDKGAEVAYFLAQNPADASRIARLPPHGQGIELARLEARLQVAPQVRKTSQTPPPVPSMPGSPSPAAKGVTDMSVDDMSKWYAGRGKRG